MSKAERRNRKAQSDSQQTKEAQPLSKLSQLFDIPLAATPGISQLQISGNREAVVDGCQGILHYDENIIKLTTGKMIVHFFGRGLQVKVLTHDSAVITGFITSIEFAT